MYDLIIIGGGPGGYTAAFLAAKLGKKVLLIEKDKLGGVCLNSGCIPTKSLLNSVKRYRNALLSESFGVAVQGASFNWEKAFSWKNEVVFKLRKDLTAQLKHKGIEVISGEAELFNDKNVKVNNLVYQGQNILLATGAMLKKQNIPGIEKALTSNDILELNRIPESITILGAGIIGSEFAYLLSSIGTEVTIIEKEVGLLPGMDRRSVKVLEKSLNVTYHFNSEVVELSEDMVCYRKNGKDYTVKSEIVLNALGRYSASSQFKNLGIVKDGKISVDDKMETLIKGIYAVGDVTGLSYLAHAASYMAEVAVSNMFGDIKACDLNNVPCVVYTDPEIASVGMSSESARQEGIPFNKSTLKLSSCGLYFAENGIDGALCTVISNIENNRIIGVHLVGSGVSEVLSLATLAIKEKYTLDKFKDLIIPHPSISEGIKQCFI